MSNSLEIAVIEKSLVAESVRTDQKNVVEA